MAITVPSNATVPTMQALPGIPGKPGHKGDTGDVTPEAQAAMDATQAAANDAQAAATVAQQARDAANATGLVFANVAAGVDATNLTTNKYFNIVSASAVGYVDLYLNANGTEAGAEYQETYPNAAKVTEIDTRTADVEPYNTDDEAIIFEDAYGFVRLIFDHENGLEIPSMVAGGLKDDGEHFTLTSPDLTWTFFDAERDRFRAPSIDANWSSILLANSFEILPDEYDGFSIEDTAGFVLVDSLHSGSVDPDPDPDPTFDHTPLFPKTLTLGPDKILVLRCEQIFSKIPAPGEILVSLSSLTAANVPWSAESAYEIEIDPARVGSTLTLKTRRADGQGPVYQLDIAVTHTTSGAGSPSVLCIGDSITDRQTAYNLKARLEAWSRTPTFIGTYPGSSSPTQSSNSAGPLGEGHGGWALTDYTYAVIDGTVTSILDDNPTNIAAYLALAKTAKNNVNTMLRPSTGGDNPALIHNGYVFDFGKYMTRFSFSEPDTIIFSVMMNEVYKYSPAQAMIYIHTLMPQVLDSIRAACPTSMIVAWFVSTSALPSVNARILPEENRAVVAALLDIVQSRADPLMQVAPVWAFQTTYDGWDHNGDPDPVTGIAPDVTITDTVHPIGVARQNIADVLAPYVAAQG